MENLQLEKHGQKPTKVCPDCGEEKPRAMFYRHKNTEDRLRRECKPCWNIHMSEYHQGHKETRKVKAQEYHYKKNYGITYKEFVAKKEAQENKCAICQKETVLVQDHCHRTNTLRSLLCSPCNQGLGSFYDTSELLRRAADYLEKELY